MKKVILCLLIVLIAHEGFGWETYGPPNIEATNICFSPDYYSSEMICTTDGMYLFTDTSYEWEYYSFEGLPVQEGIFINAETIILVLGNGTDSDGIYSFNIPTGQFNPMAYCLYPKFIEYDDYAEKYYVGGEEGLLVSDDVINWYEELYFSGIPCIDVAFQGEHVVVTAYISAPNVFYSDNSGISWNACGGSTFITRLAFYGNDLFGIHSITFSSGLYKSTDWGNTFVVDLYSGSLSDVCYDDYNGQLYVSWEYPFTVKEGIAIYEPGYAQSGLTFLNEGLPNTSITRIAYKPVIDAFYVFVCTDTGVYSYLFVDIPEISMGNKIEIFPNPVKDKMQIHFSTNEIVDGLSSIEITNNRGDKVDEINPENNLSSDLEINWNKGNLPAGVYYLRIKTQKESWSEKFIIL